MVDYVKLYKRTAGGKVQTWWIQREDDRYRMCSGQLNGAVVTSTWTLAVPKNDDRANATDAVQQAALEVESAYRKKRKQGYSDVLSDASTRSFHPMLADGYKERKELVLKALGSAAVGSQAKLDGVRCFARAAKGTTGLLSRKNTPILCPHITEALRPVFEAWPDLVLDGELYNHELFLEESFEKLVGLVRKSKLSVDQAKSLEVMEYHVYDLVYDCDYAERAAMLELALANTDSRHIVYVPTLWAQTERELDMAYETYLSTGYEGQMIRLPGGYDQKRSKLLLKRKEYIDEEFVVRDILPGKGNASDMAACVVVQLDATRTNDAGLKFSRSKKIEILANKNDYIGGEATVRYQNRTADGKLRFPRVIKFHPGGRAL